MTTIAINNLSTFIESLNFTQDEISILIKRLTDFKKRKASVKTATDTIDNALSPRLMRLKNNGFKITNEDLKDERTKYILEK